MTDSQKSDEKIVASISDTGKDKLDDEELREEIRKKAMDTDGKSMEECLGKSLETLSNAFTASARRWETIVYPSLFAFILLAGYGFYLIYNLTSDVNKVVTHMETIATNMEQVSRNMVIMTQNVDSQSASMREMTVHMRHMDVSMRQMRYDLSVMNNSVSRPMQFMNTFMPW